MKNVFSLTTLLLVSQSFASNIGVRDLNVKVQETQDMNQQQTSTSTISSSSSGSSSPLYSEQGVLQFLNMGFEGYYYKVKSMSLDSDDDCSCELKTSDPYYFSGAISPLNEDVSVHIRGPLNLQKFAVYNADSYSAGDTSGTWSREAYYDSSSSTAENVTFLGNVGKNVTCVGKALDYVGSDGVTLGDDSTVLGNVTIESGTEFAIYSNVSCESSGWSKDCGVYRKDIQAYHGYYGTTKMFLFQFLAPSEDTASEDAANYDLPAIWLLNANIPRTSQYPTNSNCSSWTSGGGEFDIFEVMNYTERLNFYSTIHDYQGTDNIQTGLQSSGYISRTPDSVMMGGVVFGSDGSATVFMSNSTSFGDTIDSSDVSSWISTVETADSAETTTLATVTLASTSSKGDGSMLSIGGGFFFNVLTAILSILAFV